MLLPVACPVLALAADGVVGPQALRQNSFQFAQDGVV